MKKPNENHQGLPRRLDPLVRAAVVWTADLFRWIAVRAGRRGWDDLADWFADLAFFIDGEQP